MTTTPSTPIELSPERLDQLDPRIRVPSFHRNSLAPGIVHIGVGGFHRAHQAEYLDDLCEDGHKDWSITGVGVLSGDAAMSDALTPQHGLYSLISRSQREERVRVIGSLLHYVHAYPDIGSLTRLMASETTRIVSLTITEGGYSISNDESPSPLFESIVAALAQRRSAGLPPFTLMSCDNVLHNGDVARSAVQLTAERKSGELAEWIGKKVAFPNSMVDRITPATRNSDRDHLETEYGMIDRWPVVAEPFRQWVIEDSFSNGRPRWEEAGALITEDVTPYELLKLRLLNAGHSTIAYLAALAGYEKVDAVMVNEDFARFLERFLDEEASPVLLPVSGIDISDYKRSLIERFSNPAIGDQVARLCLDGSSKFPIFLIPTVAAQIAAAGRTTFAALALAGWCQYLLGFDDAGKELELADDPRMESARTHARASLDEPAAFLAFSEVFPADLAANEGFRTSFADALKSLRSAGAQATVAAFARSDVS